MAKKKRKPSSVLLAEFGKWTLKADDRCYHLHNPKGYVTYYTDIGSVLNACFNNEIRGKAGESLEDLNKSVQEAQKFIQEFARIIRLGGKK